MTSPEVAVGAKVSVSAGIGHVRWTGSNPKFSAGQWVGVELLEQTGKNDGSVQGERYFQCKNGYGVFVRRSQVKVLEAPVRAPAPQSRPASTRPPPTPSAGPSRSNASTRASSPQKAALRASSSSTASAAAPSSTPRTSRTPSVASPPQSAARKASASSFSAAAPPGPSAARADIFKRHPSLTAGEDETTPRPAAATDRPISPSSPTKPAPPSLLSPAHSIRPVSPPQTTRPAAPSRSFSLALSETALSEGDEPVRPTSPLKEGGRDETAFAAKRELEELRIKVRILETRRGEDQERIKGLEGRAGEADAMRAARVKLQAKFQELQTSLVAAQRLSRDLQSENAHLETKANEATDQLEMAALDREVAEEKAEAAEAEVAKLGERLEELELEVAILKEENAEYERPVGAGEGERNSAAFVQLEKHNERLKEALIRLRDVSAESEKEHKANLAELERELTSQENLTSQLELAEAKFGNAEAHIEDLKQQLDDALGAEDMLEQLTERNLQMGERMEEMRATIEDLEALKELNDELEEGHVEAERQMNEEIEVLGLQLRDERARAGELEGAVMDLEGTIEQFRELVAGLQGEIDHLRMQQASVEVESASTSKEAQAILNLNMKLQTTAAKAQHKTIDFELKKLEAAQLADHLRIVTAFLPDPYLETEADSTTLYLFFRRLSAKLDLLTSTISSLHALPASLQTASSETLVGICELRGKLRHFASLNRRFAAILSRCGPLEWTAFGAKVLPEMSGVEPKVDHWLGMIRADEFSEMDCARELGSLIAQFDHLAEAVFGDQSQMDVGERQLGLAWSFDFDLDNFAAAVGFARQAILGLAQEDDIEVDVGDSSLEVGVYEPVQRILDLVRSVKVPSGKLVALVEDVAGNSSAFSPESTVALSSLAQSVSNAVDLAVRLAQRIGAHVASIRASKQPLCLADVEGFLDEVTAESAAAADAPPWELIGMFVTKLGGELGEILPKLRSQVKNGQVVSLETQPPWLARVGAIKEAATFNADTERKVVRLSEELKDMLREIKMRDQSLQEAGVKVETLERRLEATRKQADQIIELENDVAKAKKQEKVYEEAIEQLQAELDTLEAENAKLRKGQGSAGVREGSASMAGATGEMSVPGALVGGGGGVPADAEIVECLRSAIRFLRHENAMLKSKALYDEVHRLPSLYRHVEPPVPDLEPSSPASSTKSSDDGEAIPLTPTKHALEVESKLLFREVAAFSAKSRIVDISKVGAVGGGATVGTKWHSRKRSPEVQLWEWREEGRKLERRVERLREKAKGVGGEGSVRRGLRA